MPNWWAMVIGIANKIPFERLLIKQRDEVKPLEELAQKMEESVSRQPVSLEKTEETREVPQTAVSTETRPSKLTTEETIAYQNREIARELWLVERHLAQGCRIPDSSGKRIPCDCCEKGTFIAGLAYEAIPIAERGGKASEVYVKIARWSENLVPIVTVAAVESEQYDYKKLSGEASELRKELMGSLSFGSLLAPKESDTVEGQT